MVLTDKLFVELALLEIVSGVSGEISVDVGGRKNKKEIRHIIKEVIKVSFLGEFE